MDHGQAHWTHPGFGAPAGLGAQQRLDSPKIAFHSQQPLPHFSLFTPATTASSAGPSVALSMPDYASERCLSSTEFSQPMAPPPPPLGAEVIALSSPFPSAPQVTPAKNRRWQPPDVAWDKHKDTIFELYITRNQTLVETMRHMEQQHGFRASYASALLIPNSLTSSTHLIQGRKCTKNASEIGSLSKT